MTETAETLTPQSSPPASDPRTRAGFALDGIPLGVR